MAGADPAETHDAHREAGQHRRGVHDVRQDMPPHDRPFRTAGDDGEAGRDQRFAGDPPERVVPEGGVQHRVATFLGFNAGVRRAPVVFVKDVPDPENFGVVAYDRDGAVASLYRVGGCPTFAYAYPGGVLHGHVASFAPGTGSAFSVLPKRLRLSHVAGERTTPDVIAVHRLLAQLREEGASHVAMEVSSHALEQGRVDAVAFKVAVFTNLTRDHLDYHGTMAAYGAAKAKRFVYAASSAAYGDHPALPKLED